MLPSHPGWRSLAAGEADKDSGFGLQRDSKEPSWRRRRQGKVPWECLVSDCRVSCIEHPYEYWSSLPAQPASPCREACKVLTVRLRVRPSER